VQADAVVGEDLGDRQLGLDLGQLELGVLEVEDRLAEGLALLDVGDGGLQPALGGGDALNGDVQPLLR